MFEGGGFAVTVRDVSRIDGNCTDTNGCRSQKVTRELPRSVQIPAFEKVYVYAAGVSER